MSSPEPIGAEESPVSVGDSAVSGFFWLTAQKWVIRVLSFVTIAVLTRFLRPEDFGLVAVASSMLPFFYLLADVGFSAYVVQAEKADDTTLSTGFWFSACAGLVLFGVFLASAPWIAAVFRLPEAVPVVQAMSVCIIITAISAMPSAILRRRMRFRALAVQGTAAAAIAQVVAIVMTVTGFGVWALVAQAVVSQVVSGIVVWIAAGWRPRALFSGSEFRRMTSYGSKTLGVEFIATARAWGETVIITATLGVASLGYLAIAQRLIQVIQDMTGAAVVQVSTVAFAKIRSSADRLREAYLKSLRAVYTVMAPPLTLVAVAAPVLVPLVFGDGWSASQRPAQIYALAGILTIGAQLDSSVFYGLGKPGKWFVYALAVDALTLGTTAVAARWGLEAVAWGFLVVAIVATVLRWSLVARLIGSPVRTVASPISFLGAAVIAALAAGAGVMKLTEGLPALASLILTAVTVLAVHLLVVRLLAPQVLRELWARFVQFGRVQRVLAKLKEGPWMHRTS